MNLDNWKEKIFKIEKKPRQEIVSMPNESPRERYKSSPQEVILDSRDFEREGELLGGIIGDARFVKIRDDGGVFLSPILVMETVKNKNLYREKELLT